MTPTRQFRSGAGVRARWFTLSGAFLGRWGFQLLSAVLLAIGLVASLVVFFYPVEIEARESVVWIEALALGAGVNIYDPSQVAFVNMMYGPFDPLLKLAVARALPFLDSWQVIRVPVVVLPWAFLLVSWDLRRRSSCHSRSAVMLGATGFLILMVSAKEFVLVGRPDATQALLLLLLLYACVAYSPGTRGGIALHGLVCGALFSSVVLTNWRASPTAAAVAIFAVWLYRYEKRRNWQQTGVFLISGTAVSLGSLVLILYFLFDLDLARFYQYTFGFYSDACAWNDPTEMSPFRFALSLLNPTAHPKALKGGPVLIALALILLTPRVRPRDPTRTAWLTLAGFSFITCAVPYYLNYSGGGQWYFIPFLIVLWFFYAVRSAQMARWRLGALGALLLVLVMVSYRTVVHPTVERITQMNRAMAFMTKVRSLAVAHTVLSEDTYLFRQSYGGELVDMGDTVSHFHARGCYGAEFDATARGHFFRLGYDPPDYIVTGFTASPELKRLMRRRYLIVMRGPDFMANARQKPPKLLKRVR